MRNQKGMTLISWMVVISLVGFFFMLAIRIVPIFAEDHTIGSVWGNMEKDSALVGKSPAEIRGAVMRKLKVNNVTVLQEKDIKIKKLNDSYIVSVEYEPRGKIIGKLDFIASFKHEARIKATGN